MLSLGHRTTGGKATSAASAALKRTSQLANAYETRQSVNGNNGGEAVITDRAHTDTREGDMLG